MPSPLTRERPTVAIYRPQITLLPGGRVTRPDAALYLGKSPATLYHWARAGVGPPFQMVGRRAEYDFAALKQFVANGGLHHKSRGM